MPVIHDDEFGNITIRRNIRSRQVRIRVAASGYLSASLPPYAPLFLVKRLIKNSRGELRKMLSQINTHQDYYDGMKIGKNHYISIVDSDSFNVLKTGFCLKIQTPSIEALRRPIYSERIKAAVIKILRSEAKKYLPKRLDYYASMYGFIYHKTRFSNAGTRWGSCSSSGTISLNIALMKLPYELIDYVIIHELCHTKQMNHSQKFWSLVGTIDSNYKNHRRELKRNNPSI